MVRENAKGDSWIASALLLFVVVVLCILAGEAFLRFFYKDSIVLFPRYHTDADYGAFSIRRLKPDTTFTHTSIDGSWDFHINSKGFRNTKNIEYEKTPGTVRILSLGDSHTQGFEVSQAFTFSAVIENYLTGNGNQAEVINAGVSGFSNAEALVFLENEGIKYQPDYVVLGFFANDFSDNVKAGLFSIEADKLVIEKYKHLPGIKILNVLNQVPPIRWASENSYLYSFVFNGVWSFAKSILKSKSETALQTEYAIPTEEIDAYKSVLAVKLIERMYNFCRANNIKLIILDIPTTADESPFKSSVPDELLDSMINNSDKFIYSVETLHDYRNVAHMHALHGHRHISETTHMIYGIEAAKYMNSFLPGKPGL